MISIEKLTKTYGSKSIITNWHFTFENGKIYGLIGRNGIGKTTILKCMSGLCEADALKLSTDAGDVSDRDYLMRNIYYVSDEPVYYNDLTLKEHLWLICKIENYQKDEAERKINELLRHFHMAEYLNYYPTAMSKGTLQRMMIMIAFLRQDENLLFDEPFNGLDSVQLQQALVYCVQEKAKHCMIISSHDIESLEEICDEFLIFKPNEIVSVTGKIDREHVNRMIGESYA